MSEIDCTSSIAFRVLIYAHCDYLFYGIFCCFACFLFVNEIDSRAVYAVTVVEPNHIASYKLYHTHHTQAH